ncbi:MAG: DUF4387 domain-containing protein [Sulfolobales archaeon]|nr:DUF4387 domain-containing protein [Sulfolobales archaeon]MCX8185798.1 DUF4387 domain-containing protein [Sulfolobales archaeon]MDW7969317.1 DUF4387 domain-containing protein [Sulfolobales archaeon]
MVKLYEVAKVIRTKNAGPFKLTIDIFFTNTEFYEKAKNIITKHLISRLYNVSEDFIEGIYFVDSVLGVKITIIKEVPSDDVKTSDVYAAQQHGPLIDLDI